MMYSSHDTMITTLLTSLLPSYEFDFVPYASSIVFEVNLGIDGQHYVRLVYNGEYIPFEGCTDIEYHGCRIRSFLELMNDRLIIADDTRVQAVCDKEPVWPEDFEYDWSSRDI